ncbi:MAG: photosystem reaction center subunit H [Methanomicrobiales archaeon HGW-Methanomicrobiales-2]|nr:MAG: photosystem reaction center subunit H [Methanomicrobiales archaeon HGW-Methanomicrobiales-2]
MPEEERPSVRGGHRGGQAALQADESFEELSASALQKHLKGMDYPAGKQDLIDHARKSDAPESVIEALSRFEEKSYQSAADVSQEFGRIK